MAHVRFIADFDYRPMSSVVIAYKAGPDILTVRRECAEQAIAAGAAVDMDAPSETTGGHDD